MVGDLAPLRVSESDFIGAAELSGLRGIEFDVAPADALPDIVFEVLAPAAVVSLSDVVLDVLSDLLFLLFFFALLFFAGFCVSLDDWPLAALRSFDSVAPLAPALEVPDSDLMPVSALVRASGACVLVWAAASWLNETASRPEKSAGSSLRIEVSWGEVYPPEWCKARARERRLHRAVQETVMRKSLVLALAMAASFSVGAQQADAPGKRQEGKPQQDRQAPQHNQQAPASKEEQERIRVDGAAGGTKPVPPEERQAVGAGAGPHRHFNQPSPERLPGGEPIEPPK